MTVTRELGLPVSDLLFIKKELKGKMKFAIISVKTVKLAMENVHSSF